MVEIEFANNPVQPLSSQNIPRPFIKTGLDYDGIQEKEKFITGSGYSNYLIAKYLGIKAENSKFNKYHNALVSTLIKKLSPPPKKIGTSESRVFTAKNGGMGTRLYESDLYGVETIEQVKKELRLRSEFMYERDNRKVYRFLKFKYFINEQTSDV